MKNLTQYLAQLEQLTSLRIEDVRNTGATFKINQGVLTNEISIVLENGKFRVNIKPMCVSNMQFLSNHILALKNAADIVGALNWLIKDDKNTVPF